MYKGVALETAAAGPSPSRKGIERDAVRYILLTRSGVDNCSLNPKPGWNVTADVFVINNNNIYDSCI